MKRTIFIILIVSVGSYFTYHFFEGKVRERAEKKAEQARVQKLRESLRTAASKMAAKYSAINDDEWQEKLYGSGAESSEEIFTIYPDVA
jgi:hypothetical protein